MKLETKTKKQQVECWDHGRSWGPAEEKEPPARNLRTKPVVEFADEYIVQGAEKAPTTAEQIEKSMESLGDTPFEASSIDIEADENIFIPVGVLKNTRRKAADLLLEKILRGHKKDQKYRFWEISTNCVLRKMCSGKQRE